LLVILHKLGNLKNNMNYILDKIKLKIDMSKLFDELNIKIIRKTRDEFNFKCINKSHIDKHASSYYNINKHIWNCLGCDYKGDLLSLVMRIKKVDYNVAFKFLVNFTQISITSPDVEFLMKVIKNKRGFKLGVDEEDLSEIELPAEYDSDFNNANLEIKDYIFKRNLDIDFLYSKFVGFCNDGYFKNRLILPIIYFNKLVGFAARNVLPNESNNKDNRYLYELKAPIGHMIFGMIKGFSSSNAIFVEGIFDALRLQYYGFNAFSCLNNNLTAIQVKKIIDNFDRDIYIMPDNDAGGELMIKNFYTKLYHYKNIKICNIKSKDPDEATFFEISESINNSSILKYTADNSNIYLTSIKNKRLLS